MLHGLLRNLYMNHVILYKKKTDFSCGLGKKTKLDAK
jgi:hypothetical protein